MVYRPSLLERHLRQPEVREILVREGYDTESLENMVGQLAGRVGRSGSCEFPHEIGLFWAILWRTWWVSWKTGGRIISTPATGRCIPM